MIIVNIFGGLGNQMFQYALGYALSRSTGLDLKINTDRFEADELRDFDLGCYKIDFVQARKDEIRGLTYVKENAFEQLIRKVRRQKRAYTTSYKKEQFFHFDQNIMKITGSVYLDGYWQSEKYFVKYRQEILKQFELKEPLHLKSQKYAQLIKESTAVSLHIRRGDYVSNLHTNSVHGVCSLDYYQKAISYIEEKVDNASFFIFSDDLDWAKENLTFVDKVTFIDLGDDVPDEEEIFLMGLCEHNIIANSSFSWWGAWLSKYENKIVIAPKKWFNDSSINTIDLISERWVRL